MSALVLSFQYRERSWEGCNDMKIMRVSPLLLVSIPRTVVGGLQLSNRNRRYVLRLRCFNTENGRGRAAIRKDMVDRFFNIYVSIPRTVVGGLQYILNAGNTIAFESSFNTENGRGRAAI